MALAQELGEETSLDRITRDFHIFQRVRGHRTSTDDLLTAWYATQLPTPPQTFLDLGTGIGSVGLSLAWRFPEAKPTVVEVQAVSFRLLRENLWANGLESRVRAIHGDLRHSVPPGEQFELVTGSPPYFDVANGVVPSAPSNVKTSSIPAASAAGSARSSIGPTVIRNRARAVRS